MKVNWSKGDFEHRNVKEPSPTHPSWGEVDCLQALGEAAAVHGKSLSSKENRSRCLHTLHERRQQSFKGQKRYRHPCNFPSVHPSSRCYANDPTGNSCIMLHIVATCIPILGVQCKCSGVQAKRHADIVYVCVCMRILAFCCCPVATCSILWIHSRTVV